MSRQLEFRAWYKEPRIMTGDFSLGVDSLGETSPKDGLYYVLAIGEATDIIQYTGLKDKNGMKIFEGDIVLDGGKQSEIIFENGCFCVSARYEGYEATYWYEERMEIIGNKYEGIKEKIK